MTMHAPAGPTTAGAQAQMGRWLAAVVCASVLVHSTSAQAQDRQAGRGVPRAVEDILPLAEFEDDPIGVDAQPVAPPAPDPAPQPVDLVDERFGPRPPPLHTRAGEVLIGTPALRESAHRVHVRFADGLAHVRVELTLESTSRKPAEVHYRLAVPSEAIEASLDVCNAEGCRSGVPETGAELHRGAYDAAIRARRTPGQDGPALPVAHLARARDHGGRLNALLLRAAPVSSAAPLRVALTYTAPAPIRGGTARMLLPPRGMDPRAARAELTFDAPGLLDARIDTELADEIPVELDPWVGAELSARVPSGGVTLSAVHFDCGQRRCARLRAAAGTATPRGRELLIALDVSPSMEGPARSRIGAALIELLAVVPDGTRIRAVAFAAAARTLIEDARLPEQLSLAPFAQAASDGGLGAATRFEAAWPTLAAWASGTTGARQPLVIVIGDGGLTTGTTKPLSEARNAGVEVSIVNLADRSTTPALREGAISTGGTVIDAGAAAGQAARGRGGMRLREQLSALFAPTRARKIQVVGARAHGRKVADIALPPLRAGEEVVWEGVIGATARLRVGARTLRSRLTREERLTALGHRRARALHDARAARALVAVHAQDLTAPSSDWPAGRASTATGRPGKPAACDHRGPAQRLGGLSNDQQPVVLAHRGICEPPPPAAQGTSIGRGMPSEPLLGMLRDRIVPVARGCFRRDRAGRPDYAVRAVFEFRLAEREIVEARVKGDLEEALRLCLLAAVDGLEIPRFSGTIVVRYPLHTAREQTAPRIELSAEAAQQLDSVIDGKPAAPLP